MNGLVQAFQKLRGYRWIQIPYLDAAERYVMTGDRAALAQVTPQAKQGNAWWGSTLGDGIGRPPGWGEPDRRALHVLAAARLFDAIGSWFDGVLGSEHADADLHEVLRQELAAVGVQGDDLARITARHMSTFVRSGRLTSAGRYLLSLPDGPLREGIVAAANVFAGVQLLEFLFATAPERVGPLVGDFISSQKTHLRPRICAILLQKGGARFEHDVRRAFETEPCAHTKFGIGAELFDHAPDTYRGGALAAARASLGGSSGSNNQHHVGPWMVQHYGGEVLGDMVSFLASSQNDFAKRPILSATVLALGSGALPAVRAALEHGSSATKLAALLHLMALDDGTYRELIRSELAAGLGLSEADMVVKFVAAAARFDISAVGDIVWPLLDHKSKPVRDASARALSRLGDSALPRARELLSARRVQARSAAVTLLATANTPDALEALESRLDAEEDEDVRDAILLALQAAWLVAGKTPTPEDMTARVARVASRLTRPPVTWIDESRLPPLRMRQGRALTPTETRYLLFRQSRAKAMVADVEAAPFLELLDRGTSGDFALELLKGFLASGADAGDRWALALAGLLGDDRVVPVLARQIRDWADKARGKLAEYAVEALALLGSDEALLAVDAMAIRYRTRNKNIGKAAVEAFASAAAARGLTADELGDRVVPRLGFEVDQPRILTLGAKHIEVGIGPDFKLRFLDADSRKRIASLPKAAPKEVLADFKDLAASLKEAAKAQVLRIESLMVQQRRWPIGGWSELFLHRHLLFPFATQLVWGVYDERGALSKCFRALEDRTLTDAADAAVLLPPAGLVGVIHPLELPEQDLRLWQVHLADNEITPPFPQLERPVVLAKPGDAAVRSDTSLRGTVMNGLTFKGRAERLGWQRGSVGDGGSILAYWKGFPASGSDAFLGVEGMYIGMDMSSTVKLLDLLFVHAGSVAVGSYTYNDPENEDDPRVLPFGQVPPVVYSEVMGDLRKIAGQGDPEGA